MPKMIVTGAAGFIGSHLAEALLEKGSEVVGVDCLTDFYPSKLKLANMERLERNPSFRFVQEDLNSGGWNPEGADVVFHLAAQPGVRDSWGDGFRIYLRDNLQATQKVLDACVSVERRPRIVFASSSSVYGDAASLPAAEDDVKQPISPYGVTKLTAEMLCSAYVTSYDLDITMIRPFTVYGPRQRPDMAFSKFISTLGRGLPAQIYGDGSQTRDFTYVTDVVAAFMLAAERGVKGRVYNVGGGERAPLSRCLNIIADGLGVPLKKVEGPKARGDVSDTHADIGLARRDLGYAPKVGLEEGLRSQISWTQEN
jgi:nucleoside-diphosphate-sugar epimerase